MELYFSGAEQPIYLRQLHALGVKHIAISFFEWQRRHSNDDIYKHIPPEIKVCITAGIARKQDIDFKTFTRDYIEFCEQNAEQSLVYGIDSAFCPLPLQRSVRDQLGVLPNVVVFPIEDEDPRDLANEYERIGINATRGKAIPVNELKRIGATLYGSNITDPKKLRDARFAATTSTAWMGGLKFGELWVYAGGRLSHYKADALTRAVRARRLDIAALGVDPDLCAANNHEALTELAVISLQRMAEGLSKRRRDRDNPHVATTSDSEGSTNQREHTVGLPIRSTVNAALDSFQSAQERPRTLLPIISIEEQIEGNGTVLGAGSARMCDSCSISEVCPGYKAQSVCVYNIPVEIKSREQWEQASTVILETQFKRVMHGAFAEQVDGGDLTPRVGQEMDRFFKMLGSIKDLETTPDNGAEGPMTRFFRSVTPPGIGAGDDGEEDGSGEEDGVIEGEIVNEESGAA
jgi:hypothetical protein